MKDEIKKELEDIGSPLAKGRVNLPYGVPAGYFSGLSQRMAGLAALEGAGSLPAPAHPYLAPAGYFDQLPHAILARAKKTGRGGSAITFRQVRMAAAAVLLLAVGLATFTATQTGIRQGGDGLLANVADKDIKAYLGAAAMQSHDLQAASYVDNISVRSEDIVKYLDETGWDTEVNF